VDDPWSGFVFSNLLIYDMLKGMVEMWRPENEARIPKDLPILIASGEMDPVGGVNGEGVKTLARRYRAIGIKDLELIIYSQSRHEILNEINREEVHQAVLGWLAKHLTKPV
jgi:alpha-beta hydrolase superfamily lysophospholipase